MDYMEEAMINLKEKTMSKYHNGEISAEQAMRVLLDEERQLYERIETLKSVHQALRDSMFMLSGDIGQDFVYDGWRVRMTHPTTVESYDKKELDKLVQHFLSNDMLEVAMPLISCKKKSERSATIRIEKDKSLSSF